MSITSVFLVGTLFSGSTLLGRDLTAHVTNTHYVGEMNNLTQFPGLSHPGTPRGCHPCYALRQDCPYFTDALLARHSAADIGALHGALREALDATVVIDGSKYVAWLQAAAAQDRTPHAAVLITTRNPIAFALSHHNRTADPLWVGGVIWRDTYVDALRTVSGFGLPSLVVRYEDFMADPATTRGRVAALVGQSVRAVPHPPRLHEVGGNWSSLVPYLGAEQVTRLIEGLPLPEQRLEAESFLKHATAYWQDGTPRADDRWMRSLDLGEVNAVLSQPGLADVASLLGYNLAEVAARAVRPGL